jgi:nitrite reductase/ring-hydroxylating ferredoxin subunit
MKSLICKLNEIPDSGSKTIHFFEREVLIYKANGLPMATVNTCMHLGGPLIKEGDSFVCQWHNAKFDCASGALEDGPEGTHDRLLKLPTIVEGDTLMYVYGE